MSRARDLIISMKLKLGIQAKKSLGQNFLVTDHIIEKILLAAAEFAPHTIIEVGPGLGSLTLGLKEICKDLQLIELDKNFAEHWRSEGYSIQEVDALRWDWRQLNDRLRPLILVSNLPYQISSSILVDRCIDEKPLDGMILMFQKEVAQRIRARVEDSTYGFLSVLAQTFWSIEILLDAGPRDFDPAPKIASRVLIFNPRQVQIQSRSKYLGFLKTAFSHPRKMMISNLQASFQRQVLDQAFEKLSLSAKSRAEELRLDQFLELYRHLVETKVP